MKTARQAGWSITHSVSSSGFQFVTVRDECGNYAEFWFGPDQTEIEGSVKNSVSLLDLPISIVNLIRLWFGTITWIEYHRAMHSL